jgi:hypothetical protein
MIVIIMGHVIMAVVHVIRDGKEMTAPNKFVTTVIQIVVKITVYASIKPLVSRVVVNQDGWVRPVLLLITVLTNHVNIMPHVQIMEIHTHANVVTDGLEVNVNLQISV